MDELQPPSQPKILIIRLSSIGDIVLTTPVIRAVNEQIPEAEVHFLVRKEYISVVENNPHIHKLHAYDSENVSQVVEELRNEQFDVVIDLQKTFRSRQVVRQLKCTSYTYQKHNFSKWLCYRLKMNGLPETHIVERYFEAVKMLNVHNDHKGLEFYIPEDQGFEEDDLPMMFDDGFVAIVLAAQHFTKRIPVSKVVEIGSILHKPTAVIFGSTIPEFGCYPYMPGERNLFRNFEVCPLHCRPCSKLGSSKCKRKHFKCMNNISATDVAMWVNRF